MFLEINLAAHRKKKRLDPNLSGGFYLVCFAPTGPNNMFLSSGVTVIEIDNARQLKKTKKTNKVVSNAGRFNHRAWTDSARSQWLSCTG